MLLGGVFEGPMADYALSAPENVLRRFLAEAGHEVLATSVSRRPSLGAPADIYHAHHFGPGAYALALAGARPLVFTAHNPFRLSDVHVEESRLEHRLRALVLHAADVVVALSEREAELLGRRFGVPRERFAVIPNGLDLGLYTPGETRADGPLRVLSVGQLAPYKGHSYLLDAIARLVPRFPGLRLELASHRDDLRPELDAQARRLGIADAVSFTGPYATHELAERYRSCDVYVQPSMAECFPVTILEAMACARPVVATDVGGVREEVGDSGIVVPPRDPGALADALGQLLADPQERRRRGGAALELARTRYDGRVIASRHVELYARLARTPRRPPAARRAAAAVALAAYGRRGTVARAVPARLRRRKVAR